MTWLTALAGLAIFLFSLRFLTQCLDETVSTRIAPLLRRAVRGTFRPIVTGVAATAIVQASSITIVACMALLNRGLVNLEQGVFIMLGAAFGTTLKAWFVALPREWLGPGLLVLSSFALVFARRKILRRGLEIGFAIGMIFLGWSMLGQGLGPLAGDSSVAGWLAHAQGDSFGGLCLALVLGFVVTVLVQSSSTVVVLVVALADRGSLGLLPGAAIILGANVGTTVTEILVSLEYGGDVRRLALAHFIVKAVGAAMSLLLFKTFLLVIGAASSLIFANPTDGIRLAAVHSGFNLLNIGIWTVLSPLLLRAVRVLVRDRRGPEPRWLPVVVRKILLNAPARGLTELAKREADLIDELRFVGEQVALVLETGEEPADPEPIRRRLQGRFRAVQELAAMMASRNGLTSEDAWRALRRFESLELAGEELLELQEIFAVTSGANLRHLQSLLKAELPSLRFAMESAWASLAARGEAGSSLSQAEAALARMERRIREASAGSEGLDEFELVFIERVLSRLGRVLRELGALSEHGREPAPRAAELPGLQNAAEWAPSAEAGPASPDTLLN
jgi:Na/Pi-cotransporter